MTTAQTLPKNQNSKTTANPPGNRPDGFHFFIFSIERGSYARPFPRGRVDCAQSAPAPPLLACGIPRFLSRRDPSHEASTRGRRSRSFRVDSAQSAPAPPLLARGIPRFHLRRNPSHEKCAPSPTRIYQIVHEDPRRHGGVEGLRPAAHGQLQAILFAALRDSAPPRMGSFRRYFSSRQGRLRADPRPPGTSPVRQNPSHEKCALTGAHSSDRT